MDPSIISASSPSSNHQSFKISSQFPIRSTSLLAVATYQNICEASQHSLTSRMSHDSLPMDDSIHAGVDGSSTLYNSNVMRSMPDCTLHQRSSFNTSTFEEPSHTASHMDLFHEIPSEDSLESLKMFQSPTRKLLDRSAIEANLRAQPQPSVSTYNEYN